MDSRRDDATEEYTFDEVAKNLASGVFSRGRALKLIGAAALGAVLPSFLLPVTAEARRRRKRRPRCLPSGFPCAVACGGAINVACAACCTGFCALSGGCQ